MKCVSCAIEAIFTRAQTTHFTQTEFSLSLLSAEGKWVEANNKYTKRTYTQIENRYGKILKRKRKAAVNGKVHPFSKSSNSFVNAMDGYASKLM